MVTLLTSWWLSFSSYRTLNVRYGSHDFVPFQADRQVDSAYPLKLYMRTQITESVLLICPRHAGLFPGLSYVADNYSLFANTCDVRIGVNRSLSISSLHERWLGKTLYIYDADMALVDTINHRYQRVTDIQTTSLSVWPLFSLSWG